MTILEPGRSPAWSRYSLSGGYVSPTSTSVFDFR